ncbi:MAG: histidine kinase [Ruminococcus sp.]|nr:histidine kinase [Ruminococcus sp.]
MITMYVILDFISERYMTLMILFGLASVIYANRKSKIDKLNIIVIMMMISLVIVVCEFTEDWCDKYNKDYRILYVKTMLVYWLYPLMALLGIYLTVHIKNKLLLAVPQFVNMVITAVDLTGTGFVYSFSQDHSFHGGPMRGMQFFVICFYSVLFAYYSVRYIRSENKARGLIMQFIIVMIIVTILAEYMNFASGYADEVVALSLFVYYCYLATVHQSKVDAALHKRELELEQSKLTLLMTQIKPHFINNSLIAVRELCYEDPEKAAELINHFSLYLRNNIEAADNQMIPFTKEIDAVKEYLNLEYADSSKAFKTVFELGYTDFELPSLSVEPLVENAVKHGVDRYSEKSEVRIISYKQGDNVFIEIRDNGKGFDMNKETLGKGGIGLKNAAKRLELMCGGELNIDRDDGWTVIRIRICDKN